LHATLDKPKALAIGAFLIATFAWVGWIVINSVVENEPLIHTPWLNVSILSLAAATALSMPLVVVWHLYRAWKTEISEVGISQPRISGGNVRVPWSSFTSANVSHQFGVELLHPGGKVVVAAGLYTEPELVSAFVIGKLANLNHARTEA
jgi:hypothetical protein